VFHVAPIAKGEGSRLPAATVDLFRFPRQCFHSSDLGTVKIHQFVNAIFKKESSSCLALLHSDRERRDADSLCDEESKEELHNSCNVVVVTIVFTGKKGFR
jgi:hypothetical protein